MVKVGQEVTVKVLSIDKENRRMSLSIKAALGKLDVPQPIAGERGEAAEVKPRRRRTDLRGGVGTALWELPEEEVPPDM